MRLLAAVCLTLALTLGACGGGSAPSTSSSTPGAPAAPAYDGPAVTGTVLADAPMALSPGARLTVRLLDVTRAEGDAILVTQNSTPISAIPAEFVLPYNSPEVNSIRTYAIDATVMDQGTIAFVSQGRVRVLTQGNPKRVNVQLARALQSAMPKDPVAELNKEFTDFEARLGGLKRFTGSSVDEKAEISTAWDAFADDDGVRMVREIVSHPDGHRVNSRYAYKSGKPWVVVHEENGTSTRLGWDMEGTLIVHERNGASAEVGEGEVKSLYQDARKARSIAAAQLR